jgi:hypothetical protein
MLMMRYSVDLRVRKPIVRVGKNVGHADVLPLIFAVFAQALPRDHDGD